MIGNDRFVQVFGSVPAGDDEALSKIVTNAIREGFAVVLLKPGGKTPLCILSARDAKAADTATQTAARDIGDERWSRRTHPCGIHHALTVDSLGGDPKKVAQKVGVIIRRVTKLNGGRTPNIGVELGRSRRLVVDVDTTVEREGFMRDWAAVDPASAPGMGTEYSGMTVKSPGVFDELADEWKHKDGGHYWFTIPGDVELPAYNGTFAAEAGWVAMWADHQVLVPPSVRPEGPYEMVGSEIPAPKWLTDRIIAATVARMDRIKNRGELPDGSADIDIWSASTPWADLLDGWVDTGLPDRCSCPIFTAPGLHGSAKSATGHDIGCGGPYDLSPGHGPLHIWTDSPPEFLAEAIRRTGGKTFSKLQFLAWRDHDGAILPTLKDLGLDSETDPEFPGYGKTEPVDMFDPTSNFQTPDLEVDDDIPSEEDDDTDFDMAGSAEEAEPVAPRKPKIDTTEMSRVEVLLSRMLDSAGLDEIEESEPLIEGFLDADTVARITGKSGDGKSFLTLDMAGCIATGRNWHGAPVKQGLVVYMVAEGVRGWKVRQRAWESRYNHGEPIPTAGMRFVPFPIQTAEKLNWDTFIAACRILKPVLVVLDTQARVTVGVDENDATAMGIFVERMEMVRRATGACVLAVHHLGLSGDHGRGSTAVLGALGSELRVVKTKKGFLTLETQKQKDGEEADPLKFKLDPELDSVVPIPDGWSPDDPFMEDGPSVIVTGGEDSARTRMCAVLWDVFSHGEGATRAELRAAMSDPEKYDGKPISKAQLYKLWNTLVRDRVLIQQADSNGKMITRWKLDPAEATRLGLPELPPALGEK
jgi:hypothetical protein